jgi:hypothetical protein
MSLLNSRGLERALLTVILSGSQAQAVHATEVESVTLPGGRVMVVASTRVYVAPAYVPSIRNVEFLMGLREKGLALPRVLFDQTGAARVLLCREGYPVFGTGRGTFSAMLERGLNTESTMAGLLNSQVPPLRATLDEIGLEPGTQVGTQQWRLKLTLWPFEQAPVPVQHTHTFAASAFVPQGCNDAVAALTPALQETLWVLYGSAGLEAAARP